MTVSILKRRKNNSVLFLKQNKTRIVLIKRKKSNKREKPVSTINLNTNWLIAIQL